MSGSGRLFSRSLTLRAVRYGIAGLVGAATYFLATIALVEWAGFDPVVSSVLGFVVVVGVSYVLNRNWVFRSDHDHLSAFPRFVLITLVSLSLNTLVMYLTVHVLEWSYLLGLALATLVIPPTNFVLNHWCFPR